MIKGKVYNIPKWRHLPHSPFFLLFANDNVWTWKSHWSEPHSLGWTQTSVEKSSASRFFSVFRSDVVLGLCSEFILSFRRCALELFHLCFFLRHRIKSKSFDVFQNFFRRIIDDFPDFFIRRTEDKTFPFRLIVCG